MKTPSVIIRAKETFYIQIGSQYFFHSEKEVSFFVPLENVLIDSESWFLIKTEKNGRQILHHHEIVEIQFI